jgi:hypothetical protein
MSQMVKEQVAERTSVKARHTIPTALDDVTIGPDAREGWKTLSSDQQMAIFRFMVSAVRINKCIRRGPNFDYSRVHIEANSLT